MKRNKLDRADRRILRELQQDAGLTNVALARRIGISPPPCLRRVQALEAEGYIQGYHADLSGEKLGFGMVGFALVSLENHAESDLTNFNALIEGWPQVREGWLMSGEADYLLKIVAEDWEAFQRFISQNLTAAPNIARIRSLPAMQQVKNETGVPIVE